MSDDAEGLFREFMKKTKETSEAIVESTHVSAEVVTNVKDLLKIINDLQMRLTSSSGQSGDLRIMKSRYEKLKAESRETQKEMEKYRSAVVPAIAVQLKKITDQLKLIVENHPDEKDPVREAAKNIQGSVIKIANTF